jgi:tRNA(Ile)-lysidine synthase
MTGYQKVSDLLTNLKLSTFQKRNINVLVDGEEIVWVIGVRLSEHYKVDQQAKNIIQLIWTPSEDL